jgi:hypothetical protein
MDFKLIANPLYRTAIWSDEAVIRAVAMDRNYQVLDRYTHIMSRATVTTAHRVYQALFPFTLHLKSEDGGFLRLAVQPGGWLSLIGLLASLVGFTVWSRWRHGRMPGIAGLGLVAITGVYGWMALGVVNDE